MERVLVAMSGGVDSSASLILLSRMGYSPYGVTMELLNGIKGITPYTEKEAAYLCAKKAGAEFEAVDYSADFENYVVKEFVSAYLDGETPNPCLLCNKYIKFGRLFEKADELGIKYIATGHYARIEEKDGVFFLKKGADIKKDQSYVLCNLTQKQLSRLIFPLGGMTKEEIRSIASEAGLPNAEKKESQDICFIKDTEYYSFVSEYSGITPPKGMFVDTNGKPVGVHLGSLRYTIGQRRGLGTGFGERMYVVSKNVKTNTVTLGSNSDLFSDTAVLKNVNIISGVFPSEPFRASVKIRYQHKEQPASVVPNADGTLKIKFDEPQRAISPGQWGVIYDGDYVVGGGVIM